MASVGIPMKSLFCYYYGFAMENDSRTVQKNEAVVSARDLLGAIVERVPRSGFGPGRIDSIPATVSAILFAMEQGMCEKTISSKCNSRNMLAQFSIGKLSYFIIFFSFVAWLRL